MNIRHRLAAKPVALLALVVAALVAYRRTSATGVEGVPVAEESDHGIDFENIEEEL